MKPDTPEPADMTHVPSWVVGLCSVAAVASVLFSILLLLN
jgi:hypothetical protein